MILAIRTDSNQAEIYLVEPGGKVVKKQQWQAGRELSKQILAKINTIIAGNFVQIQAVVVYEGPGSFTSLRIGISVANALAYAKEIPIASTTGRNWLADGIKKLNTQKSGKYIVPRYGAEPNITKPKK